MKESFMENMREKRDYKVVSAYNNGDRIELIEGLFGITKQRIYQILAYRGIKRDRSPLSGKKKIPAKYVKAKTPDIYNEKGIMVK